MNSSPITAMAKHQVDRPLLQGLLTQPKSPKEFADIFISTQTQASNTGGDRFRSTDHYEQARRDERSGAPRDKPEGRRVDRDESGAERDKVEPESVGSDGGTNSAPPQVDESMAGENVSTISNDEEASEALAESGAGGGLNTAAADDNEGQEENSGGEVSADVVSIADDVDSELLNAGETPSAVSMDLTGKDKDGSAAFIAGALAGSIAKADAASPSMVDGAKQTARTPGNIVAPTLPHQANQGGDPSTQVIEVAELLADKPVAGAAIPLKNPLDTGLKPDGVMVSNDMLSGRLASNLILSSESRINTKDALKDVLGAIKGAEVVNKQSAAIQTIPAGLDSRPLTSQSIQFQAAAARLPTGLQAAVGQPGWGQAVGEKVLMMAAKNLQAAEIQLDPPELGQLQVRIVMNQDQASVTFVSPQQSVREALDESVQRLRDMFNAEGVELTDVDVSDQSQSGLAQGEHSDSSAESGADDKSSDEVVVQSLDMSLVDHYV